MASACRFPLLHGFCGNLISGLYSSPRLGRDRFLLLLATLMCAMAGVTMAWLAMAGLGSLVAYLGLVRPTSQTAATSQTRS
ncbi:hypothetical protein ACT3S8_16740 [Halomonas sp. AOP42-D2-25]|uniref:hypothetical protein n=1 Tax=Halomonas sp. AOP42-D2-25 TaxID=3457666 RepID=UPI004034B1B8